MGCRCVYPAHIGVGDIYVVADARLACVDQGKPDMGVGVAADLHALPAGCVQMFGLERLAAGGEYFCLPDRLRHIEQYLLRLLIATRRGDLLEFELDGLTGVLNSKI